MLHQCALRDFEKWSKAFRPAIVAFKTFFCSCKFGCDFIPDLNWYFVTPDVFRLL